MKNRTLPDCCIKTWSAEDITHTAGAAAAAAAECIIVGRALKAHVPNK